MNFFTNAMDRTLVLFFVIKFSSYRHFHYKWEISHSSQNYVCMDVHTNNRYNALRLRHICCVSGSNRLKMSMVF